MGKTIFWNISFVELNELITFMSYIPTSKIKTGIPDPITFYSEAFCDWLRSSRGLSRHLLPPML